MDGLSSLRTLIEGAPQFLSEEGWLLVEHGCKQANAVQASMKAAGLSRIHTVQDIAGLDRVSGGQAS